MDDCATFGHPNVAGACVCGHVAYPPRRPVDEPSTSELIVALEEFVAVVAGVAVEADRAESDARRA